MYRSVLVGGSEEGYVSIALKICSSVFLLLRLYFFLKRSGSLTLLYELLMQRGRGRKLHGLWMWRCGSGRWCERGVLRVFRPLCRVLRRVPCAAVLIAVMAVGSAALRVCVN